MVAFRRSSVPRGSPTASSPCPCWTHYLPFCAPLSPHFGKLYHPRVISVVLQYRLSITTLTLNGQWSESYEDRPAQTRFRRPSSWIEGFCVLRSSSATSFVYKGVQAGPYLGINSTAPPLAIPLHSTSGIRNLTTMCYYRRCVRLPISISSPCILME